MTPESSINSIVSEMSDRRASSHSYCSTDSKNSFTSNSSRHEETKSSSRKNRDSRRSSIQRLRTSFRRMIAGSASDKPRVHYLILAFIGMIIGSALFIGGAFVYDKVFRTEMNSASLSSNDTMAYPSHAPSTEFSRDSSSNPLSSAPSPLGTCTEDNETFTFILFFNGNVQPCKWFDHNRNSALRKSRYCGNATINANCCKSCEGFDPMEPSSSPTDAPSLSPTDVSPSPSSIFNESPSEAPSQYSSYSAPTYLDTCINNQTFVFTLLDGDEQPCSWFNHDTDSEEQKDNYCINTTIKSNCCESCEGTSYLDIAPSYSPSSWPTVINGSSWPTMINGTR